eukprot:308259-Amorphochlora_amoeboformis.AAC.1
MALPLRGPWARMRSLRASLSIRSLKSSNEQFHSTIDVRGRPNFLVGGGVPVRNFAKGGKGKAVAKKSADPTKLPE